MTREERAEYNRTRREAFDHNTYGLKWDLDRLPNGSTCWIPRNQHRTPEKAFEQIMRRVSL